MNTLETNKQTQTWYSRDVDDKRKTNFGGTEKSQMSEDSKNRAKSGDRVTSLLFRQVCGLRFTRPFRRALRSVVLHYALLVSSAGAQSSEIGYKALALNYSHSC